MEKNNAVLIPGETQKGHLYLKLDQYYIHSIGRYGYICYKALGKGKRRFQFAFQIYRDKRLLRQFDRVDQRYLKSVTKIELADLYYQSNHMRMLNEARRFI